MFQLIGNTLYAIHTVLIMAALAISIYLPTGVVVALIGLHYLHLKISHGCLLTRINHFFTPSPHNYYQELFERTFSIKLSYDDTRGLTWLVYIMAITLNIVTNYSV